MGAIALGAMHAPVKSPRAAGKAARHPLPCDFAVPVGGAVRIHLHLFQDFLLEGYI